MNEALMASVSNAGGMLHPSPFDTVLMMMVMILMKITESKNQKKPSLIVTAKKEELCIKFGTISTAQ